MNEDILQKIAIVLLVSWVLFTIVVVFSGCTIPTAKRHVWLERGQTIYFHYANDNDQIMTGEITAPK